jgi:hypothetical protein
MIYETRTNISRSLSPGEHFPHSNIFASSLFVAELTVRNQHPTYPDFHFYTRLPTILSYPTITPLVFRSPPPTIRIFFTN